MTSFPGSAWERTAREAPPRRITPAGASADTFGRQSLPDSAFPGRAWERGRSRVQAAAVLFLGDLLNAEDQGGGAHRQVALLGQAAHLVETLEHELFEL